MRVHHCAQPVSTFTRRFNQIGTVVAVLLIVWALGKLFVPVVFDIVWAPVDASVTQTWQEKHPTDYHPDVTPP